MVMEGRKVTGWAARDSTGVLSPYSYHLRKIGSEDVLFKVLYCGVDHTNLHQIRNEIHSTTYPLVPGHQVVGEVVEVGSEVKKFGVGEIVGVGCLVGSCGKCMCCKTNKEQYCTKMVFTYNAIYSDGRFTQGGFSSAMVVHQNYVVNIPDKLSHEQATPLLCAEVTAYSPLKQVFTYAISSATFGRSCMLISVPATFLPFPLDLTPDYVCVVFSANQ